MIGKPSKKGFSLGWQVIVLIILALVFLIWMTFFNTGLGESIGGVFDTLFD